MKKFFMFLAVAGLMTFTANIASAQDEGAAPAAQQVEEAEEVVDLFAGSGEEVPLHQALKTKFIEGGAGFMSLIIICLIIGMALAIERILYLAFSKTNTTKLLENVEAALAKGGIEEAKKVCRETRGPVASIFYQGLDRVNEGLDNVEKAVTSYGGVQMARLENNMTWIALFIALAPYFGFLGTVVGMVQAFDDIEVAGDISPTVVAGGMKVALLTTIFGLIVAIILQIFYNYILTKIESLVAQMEDGSITFMDILVKNKK